MAVELTWDETPYNGNVGFSRDLYDRYTLGPTIKDLWAMVQSCTGTVEGKKEENVAENQECSGATGRQNVKEDSDECVAFPEPRLPFPRHSSLTSREQQLYLRLLMQMNQTEGSKEVASGQHLQERVKREVSEFLKYLQEVAVACAEDYDYLSEGSARYMEELLEAGIAAVKRYPQVYLIHEMTSLTGGKFKPDLTLSFEKQLLALGKVNIVDLKNPPKDLQLPMDYDAVASETPPEKKANHTYAGVSFDPNAEKLCVRYKPHICLTSAALIQLLNNHGPEYNDAWELPVWVKTAPENGNGQRKVVYIDSPLVKTEMTVREKSSLFHEESLKVALKKNYVKKASELALEDPASLPIDVECPRSVVRFDDTGVDFEADFTDLETFGESSSSSIKKSNEPSVAMKRTVSKARSVCVSVKSGKRAPAELPSTQQMKEGDSSWSDVEEVSLSSCALDQSQASKRDPVEEGSMTAKRPKQDPTSAESQEDKPALDSDSDEERLVIDHTSLTVRAAVSDQNAANRERVPGIPGPPASKSVPHTPTSPSAQPDGTARPGSFSKESGKSSLKAAKSCDQLGRILRMQSAMLKPSAGHAPQPTSPPQSAVATPLSQSHPQSLVKPCVSSYLEAKECPGSGAPSAPVSCVPEPPASAQRRSLLTDDLVSAVEDEQDYEVPQEGNLVYKLYSLQDVLLLVRCSVPCARITKLGKVPNKTIPVHILPKLEYQLCYGVECLTKSEVCQLWAEKLLHTSTLSYVGHINAHTSRLFMMELMMADRIRNAACEFKPAKSLNILYHLLGKVISLQEGQYVLGHKAGEPIVTIMRACDGKKVTRATYDLHQAHAGVPGAPRHTTVPWVPVDPSHMLSFHLKHGRVPCTFPPLDSKLGEAKGAGPVKARGTPAEVPGGAGGGQPGGAKKKRKKKKNKGARAKRAQKWHQNRKLKQAGQQNSQQPNANRRNSQQPD